MGMVTDTRSKGRLILKSKRGTYLSLTHSELEETIEELIAAKNY